MRSSTRNLGLLWSGQLLSALGDSLHQIALMWIAVEAIGGRAGLVAVAGTVARLVFGPLGGVYADRWDRRRTMIWADLLRAAAVGTLALAALAGPLHLWHLAAVAAVLGVLDSLFSPALQASLPALAPDPDVLQRANALLNMNHRLARVIGPSLTGVLLAFIPITQFFAIDTATFAASALAILALRRGYAWRPSRAHPSALGARGVWDEISGALRVVWKHRVLSWGLACIGIWNVVYGVVGIVGVPLFARDVLGGGPETYGYLMGAYGVGNVAANLALVGVSVRRRARVLFGGGIVYALGMSAMAASPSLGLALAASAVAAIGGPMTDLMLLVIIQTEFPPDQIGKVFSFRVAIAHVGLGLGLLLAGPLYAVASVPVGIALAAAAMGICFGVAALRCRAQ